MPPPTARAPAVFLDRDGTMIVDVNYLSRVEDIAFFPWTVDAIRALNRAGFVVVVATNQSAVARGMITEEMLGTIHDAIARTLDSGGAAVAAYYYCPHHPDGSVARYAIDCDCRKPKAGLVERAARELGLDLSRSFVVGDRWGDVGLGVASGMKAVLVRTGDGTTDEHHPPPGVAADAVVDNLAAAASWILTHR